MDVICKASSADYLSWDIGAVCPNFTIRDINKWAGYMQFCSTTSFFTIFSVLFFLHLFELINLCNSWFSCSWVCSNHSTISLWNSKRKRICLKELAGIKAGTRLSVKHWIYSRGREIVILNSTIDKKFWPIFFCWHLISLYDRYILNISFIIVKHTKLSSDLFFFQNCFNSNPPAHLLLKKQ